MDREKKRQKTAEEGAEGGCGVFEGEMEIISYITICWLITRNTYP